MPRGKLVLLSFLDAVYMLFPFKLFLTLLLSFSIFIVPANAENEEKEVMSNKTKLIIKRMENIQISINQTKIELSNKITEYKKAEDKTHKSQLQEEITTIRSKIKELNQSFVTLSTGGIQFVSANTLKNSKLDWQGDLMEIVKPLFTALKDLTQKPRRIDNLHRLIEAYDEQIKINHQALEHIETLEKIGLNKQTNMRLADVKKVRLQHKKDAERQKNVTHFQLEEMLNDKESVLEVTNKKLKVFVTGKGLTLLLAVLTFTFILLLGNLYQKLSNKWTKNKTLKFSQRLRRILFKAITMIIAVLAMLLVFYLRNDWLFMGLAFIFLLGAAFSLKNTLPNYIAEIRLLLDISTVREGERVIYNGIPWKVEKLGLHSILINPALSGAIIRMSLKQLSVLHSRPFHENEPWFPAKEKDFVIMESGLGRYGQVMLASPETVVLRTWGGSIIHYPAADFFGLNPRNLSTDTFSVFTLFGIDYNLQNISTTEVIKVFQEDMVSQIKKQKYGADLIRFETEFFVANASSLDYKLIAHFDKRAAQYYRYIERDLQKFAVNICNEQDWGIPFQQVVIHKE